MAEPSAALAGLDGYVESARPEFESKLGALVNVPTVSADPQRKAEIGRGAELAAQYLKELGARAEIVETPGNPVVFARLLTAPVHPTITIYNHLDVQPAQEPEWTRDPFVFHIQDGRYYGRGATDDKGPALTGLFAARYARDKGLPLNFHFIWELEEEIGSPNFEHFVLNKLSDLRTDSVLVSDTVWISRDIPAVPYGLRGLQVARLTLETGQQDAHSGTTGGAARNPLGELCTVIARCHDPATGRVNIPGFYDAVVEPTDQEMDGLLSTGFDVANFMRVHGLKALRTQDKREVIKRIWCYPTFEVHGIAGGYTGPGVKTVVPPRAEAKVSMRLVPKQEPSKVLRLLEAFVHQINPDVQVEGGGSLEPYLGESTGPYPEAARQALRVGFGREPAFTREGGSIGAAVTMRRHLRVPLVFLGLSLPEHGYHAPNEHFDWGQASGGIKALVKYFSEISALKPAR